MHLSLCVSLSYYWYTNVAIGALDVLQSRPKFKEVAKQQSCHCSMPIVPASSHAKSSFVPTNGNLCRHDTVQLFCLFTYTHILKVYAYISNITEHSVECDNHDRTQFIFHGQLHFLFPTLQGLEQLS